ncbi:peptidylprolyl isomerase [Aeromicrobium sp. P5_D10]
MRIRLFAASALLLVTGGLAACGSSESDPAPAAKSSDAPAATADAPAASGECVYNKSDDAAKDAKVPPAKPESASSLTIATNRGDIEATLKPDTAPCTVNSFVSLAKQGYFDDTKCHRLVPGFVLQCGDPSATGTGGPGYAYADELKGDEKYPAGTLAMANSGPDTNGSQFFIVLADAELDPKFTVFGSVDDAGLKLAQKIADEGNGADGVAPKKDVVIESVS